MKAYMNGATRRSTGNRRGCACACPLCEAMGKTGGVCTADGIKPLEHPHQKYWGTRPITCGSEMALARHICAQFDEPLASGGVALECGIVERRGPELTEVVGSVRGERGKRSRLISFLEAERDADEVSGKGWREIFREGEREGGREGGREGEGEREGGMGNDKAAAPHLK